MTGPASSSAPNRLFIAEQNALGIGGHYFNYTRCIAEAAIALGLETVVLTNRRLVGAWDVPGLRTLRAFTFTWGEAEGVNRRSWGTGNLAFEFVRAVADDPPAAGDHVLFHTLGFAELRLLLDYLTSVPKRSNMPTFHILLRYDSGYMLDDIASFRPLFERVAGSQQLRHRVRLHADTKQLAVSFGKLTRLPFTQLPIPFDQRYLRGSHSTEALTFAYVGDARLEKGYGLLPEAIASMRSHFSSRPVRFVIQSNFNTPGGEAGMLAARSALSAMKDVDVRLEPLSGEAYYEQLCSADAILLPYDAQRYAARSSGILIEALAAGKPILTTAGSWLATQVNRDHAVVYGHDSSLAAGLLELVTRFDELASGAAALAPRWRSQATGRAFVEALLRSESGNLVSPKRKRVLVVMNGDAMVLRNGASRIALAQFAYLQEAGYQIAALFLGYDAVSIAGDVETWRTILTDRVRTIDFEALHALILNGVSQHAWRNDPAGPSVEGDLEMHRHFYIDEALVSSLCARPIDAVLLNYVTAIPIVHMLGLVDVPIICEMHDIQSAQKAIYGRRPPDPADFVAEWDVLAKCRHVIALNPNEAEVVRAAVPGVPVTVTGVFPDFAPSAIEVLAGSRDFADVAASCGPTHFPQEALTRLRAFETIDFIFVGSNHRPNVSGLRWFIEEIFLPRLAPRGHTLVVAGSVTDYEDWPKAPGIVYLGRVASLDPLYAAAKLVLLPVLEGAGSPVKTFEALRHGKPVVATPQAFRGIDLRLLSGITLTEDVNEFGDAALRLLEDSGERHRCAEAILRLGKALADPRRFITQMNTVFDDVLGEDAPQVESDRAIVPISQGATKHWTPVLAAANAIVRDALIGRPSSSEALATVGELSSKQLADMLDEIVSALLEKQSAPLLRHDAGLLRAVAAVDLDQMRATLEALHRCA